MLKLKGLYENTKSKPLSPTFLPKDHQALMKKPVKTDVDQQWTGFPKVIHPGCILAGANTLRPGLVI
jgi:hypothetical protein